jgi:predicted Holliday junction resolvase-like endonuclease
MDILTLVFILAVGICIGILFSRLGISNIEKYARKDAVHTSRSVILDDVYEKILPSLPGFIYAPKDMVFVGK